MHETTSLRAQSKQGNTKRNRGWRITSRDLDILAAIYGHRFLTRQLVEWVFFSREDGDADRRSSLAARRLQVLYEAGYVQRLILPVLPGSGRTPAVYALGPRGADALASHLGIDREKVEWQPRHNRTTAFFMEHALAIARLWAALTAALRHRHVEIERWVGEGALRGWELKGFDRQINHWVPIRPDGYMELIWPDKSFAPFFIEVDMGTETNARVERKLRAYQELHREVATSNLEMRKFYLLVVTSGDRRMENLRRIASKTLSQNICFFATLDDLHPARVLTAWRDINDERVHLTGFFEDDSTEECHQVDVDVDEDDDGYYDDEDKETWLP
jgi:hypothetical protein